MNLFISFILMAFASWAEAQVCSSKLASASDLEILFQSQKDSGVMGRFKVQVLEQQCDVNSKNCSEWLVSNFQVQITDQLKNSGGQDCKGCYYFEGPLDLSQIKDTSNYVAITGYIQDYWRSFNVREVEVRLVKKQSDFEAKINFFGEANPQMPNILPKNIEAHSAVNKDIASHGIYTHEIFRADYTVRRVSKSQGLYDESVILNHRSRMSQLQVSGSPSLKSLGVARVNIHKDQCLDITTTVVSEIDLETQTLKNYKMEFLGI